MTAPREPDCDGWVSLSFDDGIDQHLDHAIPVLERHGLTGTFYVHITADSFLRRFRHWRAAVERGHELGNHTLFHPADRRKTPLREGQALDTYTLDRMKLELETTNRLLESMIGCPARTFAYPHSNPVLGQSGVIKRFLYRFGFQRSRLVKLIDRCRLDIGSNPQSYVPVVKELFLAARRAGLRQESPVPALSSFNQFLLPSVCVRNWSALEMIRFAEKALTARRWVIFQFHGIGGGHPIDCDLSAFRTFIAWLGTKHARRVGTIRHFAERVWQAKPALTLARAA